MCAAIASDIMMSFCGVLKTQRRLASTGSTIVAEAAIEIIGVCALGDDVDHRQRVRRGGRAEDDVDLVLGDQLARVADRRRGGVARRRRARCS